uniref:Translocase of inner mitochondrial membrane 29 n=1 Tax=Lepisosteus oculatus TaxID=7918 RepID=W5MFZ0_LEPOC
QVIMAAAWVLRRWCSSAARAAEEQSGATRIKGSLWNRARDSRIGLWLSSLLGDYREACRDVIVGLRERPLKAAAYLSLLGGVWGCYHRNPGPASFESCLLEASNTLLLLSPWIRSGTADAHVQGLVWLRNEGRLRCLNLGVATLAYSAPFDPDSSLYEARCPHLRPRWLELPERLLDVGFLGRWWVLERHMRDCDINEEEFRHLPSHLRSLSPSALRSEVNEQLHRDSQHPVTLSQADIAQAELQDLEEAKGSSRGQ